MLFLKLTLIFTGSVELFKFNLYRNVVTQIKILNFYKSNCFDIPKGSARTLHKDLIPYYVISLAYMHLRIIKKLCFN